MSTPVFPTEFNSYIKNIANAIMKIVPKTFHTSGFVSLLGGEGVSISETLKRIICFPQFLQYSVSAGLSVSHFLHFATITLSFYISNRI